MFMVSLSRFGAEVYQSVGQSGHPEICKNVPPLPEKNRRYRLPKPTEGVSVGPPVRQVRTMLTSRCAGAKHKVEVCSHGERAEVPVARDERNALVDTALGDQRIAETGLAARGEHLSPQRARRLPIARRDLEQRHFRDCFSNIRRKARVA